MTTIADFIDSIPKAELHVHVEGTLEPELKFELAERNGLELPYASVAEMRAAYDFDDLSSFLVQYYEGMSVLLTEQDFPDLAMAYFTRVAAQNVVYVELFLLHGGSPDTRYRKSVKHETIQLNGLSGRPRLEHTGCSIAGRSWTGPRAGR